MIEYTFYYPAYPLWDYEVNLARREVQQLTRCVPISVPGGLRVTCIAPLDTAQLRRLTFCHRIVMCNGHGPEEWLTYQALIENTAKLGRRANHPGKVYLLLDQLLTPPAGRRESQYVTHGTHDYKGKFYPQLVRSLLIGLGAQPGQVVVDPFGGSGTTLVECYLTGLIGVSVDRNPLAHLVTQAKLACFSLPAEAIIAESERLVEAVRICATNAREYEEDAALGPLFNARPLHHDDTPPLTAPPVAPPLPYTSAELTYLQSWFAPCVLQKLFQILHLINSVPQPALQQLYHVLLSQLLRDCSQQDPRDLRIRRRSTPLVDAPVYTRFVQQVENTSKQVVAFLLSREVCGVQVGTWEAYCGDARALHVIPSPYLSAPAQVDFVVTSPPYATALPYLDTQRLSLALLRLTNEQPIRRLDQEMIGNREITVAQRTRLERQFFATYQAASLPTEVKQGIRDIHEHNTQVAVGFRRKNMTALLYQYFTDMKAAMREVRQVLKPGAPCVFVVGNNITTAGDTPIEVKTDHYLRLIGQSVGLDWVADIPITVTTEDLAHRKHAIRENTILIFQQRAGA